MKKNVRFCFAFLAALLLPVLIFAHCQIPCGIYDDEMRFEMMEEHIKTIEKSMNQINELSKDPDKNMNQIVRWVNNKDLHADEFSHIVTYYFMTQRVKPVDKKDAKEFEKYVEKVTLLQQMLVYGMKTKQTTDLENVNKLRDLLAAFETGYSGKKE